MYLFAFLFYFVASYFCTYFMLKHWNIAELCSNKDELLACLMLAPITMPLLAILSARNNFPLKIRNPFDVLVEDIVNYRGKAPATTVRKTSCK